MAHLLAYLSRMRHIRRWGLMKNNEQENILEHSAQCAMIAHSLALLGNARLGQHWDADRVVTLAIFHDAPEVITGDLATPIKYFNPDIRDAYKHIEAYAAEKLTSLAPDDVRGEYSALLSKPESEDEWKLVKAADRLCAYIKCIEEVKAGNMEFTKALTAVRADIDRCTLPEVDLFLLEYLPSYGLTLDELN